MSLPETALQKEYRRRKDLWAADMENALKLWGTRAERDQCREAYYKLWRGIEDEIYQTIGRAYGMPALEWRIE